MGKNDLRTVAFHVDPELFERFKKCLEAKGIKQRAFFLNCIYQALGETPDQQTTHSEEV